MWTLVNAISERYSSDDDQSDPSNHRFLQLLAQLAPMAMNLLGGLFGGGGGRRFSEAISLLQRFHLEQAQQPAPAAPASPQQIISRISLQNRSLELLALSFQFNAIQPQLHKVGDLIADDHLFMVSETFSGIIG